MNGTTLPNESIARVRPSSSVYPAISIDEGSSADVTFLEAGFQHQPANKQKFKMIIGASSLI